MYEIIGLLSLLADFNKIGMIFFSNHKIQKEKCMGKMGIAGGR